MEEGSRWKWIERISGVVGLLCTLLVTFIEVSQYFGSIGTKPATGAPPVSHAVSLQPANWLLIFVAVLGVALLASSWVMIFLRQKRAALPTNHVWNPQGLYVGLVHVDVQHLATDLLIEVAARFFNGTGVTVDVSKVTGWITYFDSTQMNPGTDVKLPAPQLLDDRGGVTAIAANREGQAVLAQRVPREVASRILEQMVKEETVCLSLDGLNLIVEASSHDKEPLRMPLWNAVTLRKDWPVPFVGRLITATVNIKLGASDTVN